MKEGDGEEVEKEGAGTSALQIGSERGGESEEFLLDGGGKVWLGEVEGGEHGLGVRNARYSSWKVVFRCGGFGGVVGGLE